MKKIKPHIFFCIITTIIGCTSKNEHAATADTEEQQILHLSAEQQRHLNIILSQPEYRTVSKYIEASGQLDVPPQHLITISAPLGGFIKRTPLLEGMRVRKGDVLVEMEHPEYIQLQQDYLQALSRLKMLKAEYIRQEELERENVTAIKAREKAQTEYETAKVEVESLRARLKMLHIDPEQLTTEGIRPVVAITSPINGYVTRVNVSTGAYVQAQHELFRLIDPTHLHAELFVFEKDLSSLQEGQRVIFTLLNDTIKRYAKVYLIGKELTTDRTVRVHCHLDHDYPGLIPGLYIRAQIETASHRALTVPESAVVRIGNQPHVFVARENDVFELTPVRLGAIYKGYAELADTSLEESARVVTSPAYTLLSMLRNRGEE